MDSNNFIGTMVLSKSGRDKDRYLLVVKLLDENYVYISDGDLRPIEKPKKKKIKHLNFTNVYSEEIREMLIKGSKVSNKSIKAFLKSKVTSEEVCLPYVKR